MARDETFDQRLRERAAEPDQPFRVAFGCYLGVLVTALAVAFLVAAGYGHPAVVVFASTTVFVVTLVLGTVASRRWPHGPARLGNSPSRFLFVVPGVGLVLLGLFWPAAGAGVLVTTVLSGILTGLVGACLALMCENRYVDVCIDGTESVVNWAAPWPRSVRVRWAVVVNSGLGCLLAIGVVAVLATQASVRYINLLTVFQLIFVANVPLFAQNDRGFSAYDEGLVPDSSVSKRLYRWDEFEGYSLTDSELRIERSWRPDLRFDRREIEDADAVVAALDDHLPESDHNDFSRWFPRG